VREEPRWPKRDGEVDRQLMAIRCLFYLRVKLYPAGSGFGLLYAYMQILSSYEITAGKRKALLFCKLGLG
jgi:hypothetical protein